MSNKKIVGGFLKTFGKGLLKEAVSYVPIIGDNLANTIDKKVGKQVSDDSTEVAVEVAGKVVLVILVVSLIAGFIDLETLKEIVKIID